MGASWTQPIDRRRLLGLAAAAGFIPQANAASNSFRFGLTPVFLDSDVLLLESLSRYLGAYIGQPVELIKRRTYQEITLLLLSGQLDAAWICGFPYIQYRDQLALVAVPLYRNQPLYQSYLIVNRDNEADTIGGLAGDVHAFSDPDSNSGFLVTRALMADLGQSPDRFFRHHFFAYGHRNVIRAVASCLADSGSVDGYVYDVMAERDEELTEKTRVIRRSEQLGFPPIACRKQQQDAPEIIALGKALRSMSTSDEGKHVLDVLRLDGFVDAEPGLFDGIAEKFEAVRRAA